MYDNFNNNPLSHASPFARIMEQGKVKSLTPAGVRTLTAQQREQAKKIGVSIIEMKDFNTAFMQRLSSPLYISLDLDVLDPAFAPGISHHEPGGLSSRELIQLIQQINVPIAGADLVEYNLTRDINDTTAMLAYKLLKELISKMMANVILSTHDI
ncbi:MAG: arginase family protein [Chitinophagaceae bacterium]